MKRIFILAATAAAVMGCSGKNNAEFVDVIALGAKVSEVKCPQQYGDGSFFIIANEWVANHDTVGIAYDARIVKGSEWLSFKENGSDAISRKGSGYLEFEFTTNRGLRRCATIMIQSGNRRDSLKVKQEGLYSESIKLVSDLPSGYKVPEEGGNYSFRIESDILPAELMVKKARGLGEAYMSGNILYVEILPSDSRDERKIDVTVYKLDAWGEEISSTVTLTQLRSRLL